MVNAWMCRAATMSAAVAFVLMLGAGCATSDRPDGGTGSCSPACGSFEMCCATGGTSACRATPSDPANCGGCGVACAAGQSCLSGVCTGGGGDGGGPTGDCTPACSSAQRCCGTACVNRSAAAGADGRSDSSFMHCNGCGIACDSTRANACSTPFGMSGAPSCLCGDFPACAVGEVCAADSGGTWRCTNTMTDPTMCGSPPVRCADGEICAGGTCSCGGGAACASGQGCCGGACVDITSDAANCGACGTACGGNAPDCNGGTCGCGSSPACAAPMPPPMLGLPGGSLGETCCSGSCVANSTSNCGSCGTVCEDGDDCIMASGGLPFPGLPMGTGVCCGTEIPFLGGLCTGGGLPTGDGGLGFDGGLPFP